MTDLVTRPRNREKNTKDAKTMGTLCLTGERGLPTFPFTGMRETSGRCRSDFGRFGDHLD